MEIRTPAERSAAEVRAHLARRSITRSALAQHIGLSGSAMARRLSGEVPFDVDELTRIARFLGVDAAALLGQPDSEPVSA